MRMGFLVGLILSIPSILNAQDWREELRADLVVHRDDKMVIEGYSMERRDLPGYKPVEQEQGPRPVIRVPALAPETPPPWRSFAEKPLGMFAEPSLSNRDAVVGWSDWSNGERTLFVVLVIVPAAATLAVILLIAG